MEISCIYVTQQNDVSNATYITYETQCGYFNPEYDLFLNLTEKFWFLMLPTL